LGLQVKFPFQPTGGPFAYQFQAAGHVNYGAFEGDAASFHPHSGGAKAWPACLHLAAKSLAIFFCEKTPPHAVSGYRRSDAKSGRVQLVGHFPRNTVSTGIDDRVFL